MNNNIDNILSHHKDLMQDTALQALNDFLDGELSIDDQPALFAHLAVCESCRQELEGVMKFRRLSRVESLTAPPALDAALFKRLKTHKAMMSRIDRAEDRRPLWNVRTPVSVRATVMTVLLVFFLGLFYPSEKASEYAHQGYVSGSDELIEFADMDLSSWNTRTLYVFVPGITVEASPEEERIIE